MHDWNVVISLHERSYIQARELLERLGQISRTSYFNVLVMKVEDRDHFLETLRQWTEEDATILTVLARVIPVTQTFHFQSAEEFEAKARQAMESFIPALVGKSFHLRMHRRGFKGRLSSQQEERFLDDVVLTALDKMGKLGRITFEDPDAIVALETVDGQAGLSLWSRADMQRHPFLRLD